MENAITQLKFYIEQSQNILIVGHKNPDGDTIGSVLGFYGLLKKLNKNVVAIFPDEAPEFLKWLPFYNEILIFDTHEKKIIEFLSTVDLIIGLDFNEKIRMGKIAEFIEQINCNKAIIDHHPYPDPFFDIIISDVEVSSTAELVFRFIESCQWINTIDINIATCIFTGIMTDTLSFNVNAHRPSTYITAAKLLSFGVDKNDIHQKVFYSYSEQRMRLLGYALHKKMKIIHEWSTGYIWLNKEELKNFCFQKGDNEGIVNYPLNIKGIKLAALFLEKENYIKISMRSIGNVPANEIISKHFVGGGHLNAAGGEEYNLSLEDTLKKFESILPLYKTYLLEK
ncbi:MAG: bifunctional oligoribonuclease/PAP phosphatase NrnA [Bacteroidales bacterium]|nr:bifunctional oligoribonuclease/PAP phosphatase NrnA [Bacteroidales bacterium]